ncbi:MAG: APC family permease [Kineosporiaceae bacterium]
MPSVFDVPKRMLLGRARSSGEAERTLLPRRLALPVFASDPVSSVAYAGQELVLVLALGGVALLALAPSVALAVCLVVTIVVVSYGQVVRAYPGGGGSYAAASENLGPRAGTVTAASLTVDYVLTVAVSTAAAAQTVVGVLPALRGYELILAIAAVLLVMLVNLRGRREAGWAAMVPVYGFVLVVAVTVAVGLVRAGLGDTPRAPSADLVLADTVPSESWLLLVPLVLRAFVSGGAALAGVEAISNGTPSFRPPQARNAATTLLVVGAITVALFGGVITLAGVADVRLAPSPCDFANLPDCENATQESLLPQLASAVWGAGSAAVPLMVVATVGVLLGAANSAYNGFPLLAAVLANDRYAPRQLAHRGDRLAYTNGIVFLSVAAVLVLLAVTADVSRLVDLYLLGLLLSFTLAQLGMARRFRSEAAVATARARRGARGRLALATVAALSTGAVFLVSVVVKIPIGAWATVLAGVGLYLFMRAVRSHYDTVADRLALDDSHETMPARVHAVVLVSRLHKPVLRALAYARATRPATLEAVTVAVEPEAAVAVLEEWERRRIPVPLRVLDAPYREITGPLMTYVTQLRHRHPRDAVTVFVPEYVVGRWWQSFLHNQSTLWLKSRLEAAPGVMVVSVPWLLTDPDGQPPAPAVPRGTEPAE